MIDITQPLGRSTAVWPGDAAFEIDWTLHLGRGDNVSLSRITFSPHVGTHADAPAHYEVDGPLTGGLELAAFLGPVQVIDARWAESVSIDLLEAQGALGARRLLTRSLPQSRHDEFASDFPPLAPEAADTLVRGGLRLYGTDAPSVDPVQSAAMSAHRVLGAAGVPILENLDLSRAEPGEYDLVALPLKLVEAEATPVRAVLLPLGTLKLGG
ncbi:MAG: cyclase family protein [Gemmatimonadota bacterium]|nr:MAG: cyclase family protein [Gemmatimonadota bacterium]